MPVSPAWPVAAERIQDREKVGGGQWRAGNGPPGGKAQRAQQSLGRTRRVRGGAGGETPGGSLPLTYPRGETPGGGSLLLTPPQKVPMGRVRGRTHSPH